MWCVHKVVSSVERCRWMEMAPVLLMSCQLYILLGMWATHKPQLLQLIIRVRGILYMCIETHHCVGSWILCAVWLPWLLVECGHFNWYAKFWHFQRYLCGILRHLRARYCSHPRREILVLRMLPEAWRYKAGWILYVLSIGHRSFIQGQHRETEQSPKKESVANGQW